MKQEKSLVEQDHASVPMPPPEMTEAYECRE